ncbi:MAG: pilus assembly protein PilM [bacterium]|nr:pilus assembly protein PilM [bacterium]
MFNPLDFIFKKRVTSVLGIDIGTSSIKIVELRRESNSHFNLLNYAVLAPKRSPGDESVRGLLFDLEEARIAQYIKFLIKESGFTTDTAVMSLPIFSTFVTIMEMPILDEKAMANAVPLQAREYIPIPISEVVLDWKIVETTKKSDLTRAEPALPNSLTDQSPRTQNVGGAMTMEEKNASTQSQKETPSFSPKHQGTKVLLMAAPRDMVQKYVRIAQLSELTLMGLEIESFALARAGALDEKTAVLLLDMGAFSSSIAVFDEGSLRIAHHVGIASSDFTRACSRALGTDMERAESYKQTFGLYASGGEKEIVTAYLPLLEALAREVERVMSAYWKTSSRQITRLILSGNTALLRGLDEYFASRLRLSVQTVSPFSHISLPKDLVPVSGLIGPELANAAGLAMKEI